MAINAMACVSVPDVAAAEATGTCNREVVAELKMLLGQILQEPAAVQKLLSGQVVQLEEQLRQLGALCCDA